MTAQDLDALRLKVGDAARVVCVSFERFGTGSDVDRSFSAGKFFTGQMFYVDQKVYHDLFGRKGFMSGLMTMSSKKIAQSRERKVGGNVLLGVRSFPAADLSPRAASVAPTSLTLSSPMRAPFIP